MEKINFTIKYNIPLYKIKMIYYFYDNLLDCANKIKTDHNIKKLYKLPNKEIKLVDGVAIGQFIPTMDLIYILIRTKDGKVSFNTLTHENYHVTSKIMCHTDFDFYHSDEPFAMLNGVLNSEIIEKINNNKAFNGWL